MNTMGKKFFIFAFLIFVSMLCGNKISAQESSALYFSSQPQAANYNPSFIQGTRSYISLPVISRVNVSFGTSGFAYNDLVHQHPQYADSLQMDFDGLLKKLKKSNSLSFSMNTDIVGVGFKFGEHYFSVGSSFNVETKLGFSKDMFDFIAYGTRMSSFNVDVLDERLLNLIAYTSTYFGYAREINDQLTLGVRLKMYGGVANVETNKSKIKLQFDESDVTAYGDFSLNVSTSFGHFKQISTILSGEEGKFDFYTNSNTADKISKSFKNMGFGVDLGATYKLNDQMTFSASIIDFGRITWKSNTQRIRSKYPGEKFSFSGLESSHSTIGENIVESFEDIWDSIKYAFDLMVEDVSSYSTAVPTKIHLGYSWNFQSNMYLDVLYRGRFINSSYENSLMLNYTLNIGRMQVSVGNTISSSLFNPALFLSFGSAFYVGMNFSNSLNVKKANSLGAYLGLNLAIKNANSNGHHSRGKKSNLDRAELQKIKMY